MSSIAKIVSGGQAGADRAAIDFAIRLGVRYGGWVPKGGWAEDFEEPPGLLQRYPMLKSTGSADLELRTSRNVRDSDGTLVVILPGTHSPGTTWTVSEAIRLERPFRVVDPISPEAHEMLESLVQEMPESATLNVAGPRESESTEVYDTLTKLLEECQTLFISSPHGG